MDKVFRGKMLHITVKNPDANEYGVKSVTVNGKKTCGLLIKEELLAEENFIVIEM